MHSEADAVHLSGLRLGGWGDLNLTIRYQYKSRRNNVQQIETETGIFVRKAYQQREMQILELNVYNMLKNTALAHPQVMQSQDGMLVLSWLPGITLLEELEEQERSRVIFWDVWKKLTEWVIQFNEITGFVVTDPNLRNFIYDAENGMLYGLDFEECAEGDVIESIGRLAAFVRLYDPMFTPTKQAIADYILREAANRLDVEPESLLQETKKQEALLQIRRRSRQ